MAPTVDPREIEQLREGWQFAWSGHSCFVVSSGLAGPASPVFIGAYVDGAFFSGSLDQAAIYVATNG